MTKKEQWNENMDTNSQTTNPCRITKNNAEKRNEKN